MVGVLRAYDWSENPGSGAVEDPYQISTVEQLLAIGSDAELLNKHFRLESDLNLNGVGPNPDGSFSEAVIAPDIDNTNWTFDNVPFTGGFDGNGFVVRNLKINSLSDPDPNNYDNDFLGLFGKLGSGATVTKLGLLNIKVTGGDDTKNLGGLCGYNFIGAISNCYAIGSVIGGYKSYYHGGLCGRQEHGSISNCYSQSNLSGGDSSYFFGGLCGSNSYGSISHCYSTGSIITSDTARFVGGFCGSTSIGWIRHCYWNVDNAGVPTSSGGWALTAEEMTVEESYIGWNNGFWVIDPENDYPRLAWESSFLDVIDYEYPVTYSGNGADEPFVLANPDDIISMTMKPAHWDKKFVLANDIDMTETVGYRSPMLFTGVIDGRGYMIRNLSIYVNMTGNRCQVGFIGRLDADGLLKNLALYNVIIAAPADSAYVGGLCGYNYAGAVSRCFSTGHITGGSQTVHLGGLCGYNATGVISESYSTANITAGNDSRQIAGFCGGNAGMIDDCYSSGIVAGSASTMVGGFCGKNYSADITDCYWDIDSSTIFYSDGGVGKKTNQMQQSATFLASGWDFINTWNIIERQSYPGFRKYRPGDINLDGAVNLNDLSILALNWLIE